MNFVQQVIFRWCVKQYKWDYQIQYWKRSKPGFKIISDTVNVPMVFAESNEVWCDQKMQNFLTCVALPKCWNLRQKCIWTRVQWNASNSVHRRRIKASRSPPSYPLWHSAIASSSGSVTPRRACDGAIIDTTHLPASPICSGQKYLDVKLWNFVGSK